MEHVETSSIGDAPEVGDTLSVRGFVALGDLTPEDMQVQLVHGVINSEDVLVDTTVSVLQAGETYEGDRYRFDGEVVLERSGPFSYTSAWCRTTTC